MKIPGDHNYYFYFTTNTRRTVLYAGVTNDLKRRVQEHFQASGNRKTFAGRYRCFHLIYYEWYGHIEDAIAREKKIKKWRREKKEWLIARVNPQWFFLSEHLYWKRIEMFCGNELP